MNEAVRHLTEFDGYRIDFAKQPVWPEPLRNMVELRSRGRFVSYQPSMFAREERG